MSHLLYTNQTPDLTPNDRGRYEPLQLPHEPNPFEEARPKWWGEPPEFGQLLHEYLGVSPPQTLSDVDFQIELFRIRVLTPKRLGVQPPKNTRKTAEKHPKNTLPHNPGSFQPLQKRPRKIPENSAKFHQIRHISLSFPNKYIYFQNTPLPAHTPKMPFFAKFRTPQEKDKAVYITDSKFKYLYYTTYKRESLIRFLGTCTAEHYVK